MEGTEKNVAANLSLKKFRAGAIIATVWSNQTKDGEGEYKTVSLERSYKDKEGIWKYTSSLRTADLPRASLVLQKAFEYLALSEGAEV